VSFDAVRWALEQPVPKSSTKFVLVAMADCVHSQGEAMVCWPTVAHLAKLTALDRKTVIEAMQRLRQRGWINDTGERRGATGQVPVYELKTPASGTVTDDTIPAKGRPKHSSKSPENGTDAENGTVPKTDANSPEIPHQRSRNSLSTVPKTGHGTRKEQGTNKEGTKKDAVGVESIPGVPDRVMADWLAVRKAKRAGPVTESVLSGMSREAAKAGLTLPEAVQMCAESSWQGFQARYLQNQQRPSTSAEPAWRTEQRRRTQIAAPGVAAKDATDFFLEVEARDVTPRQLG
jgi:hypothetical protein